MKIALVGESYGAQEVIYQRPFVGSAGQELNRCLKDAGLLSGKEARYIDERSDKYLVTNVFNFRPSPDDDDILLLCARRTDLPAKGKGYPLPHLQTGWYVKPEHLGSLDRLKEELEAYQPNLTIALGNTALWALTKKTGINKWRGATMNSTLVPGMKVLPTFHPAAIFRDASLRPTLVLDLIKAKEEAATASIHRKSREVWIEPTLTDLYHFSEKYINGAKLIAFDIENPNEIISCVSIATDDAHAIVVPFEDQRKPAYNYWPTRAEELEAWRWLKVVLESPIPKLAQNGMYDIGHLREAGIYVRNFEQDTMLLHHALQPEEKKGLGYLASIYTNESAFKQLAPKQPNKRDS